MTNDFEVAPTIDEVKKYINEVVENGTKFATLSPNWFVDIQGSSKKKSHIIKSSNFSNMSNTERKRHDKYVMSLEKLLSKAQYIGEKENTKQDKKPNIAKYHYFQTKARIGNKVYQLIFDTEEYKKPQSVGYAYRNFKEHSEDTDSINDIVTNINPKTVHLYNISEIKRNNIYYQEQDNIDNARGFTYNRTNFDGTSKDNLVVLLKGKADKSTLLHEFAHVYLTTLNNLARTNDKAKDMLIKVNKFLRYNGKQYTTAQHEKFANNFVAYVRTGKAPRQDYKYNI